MKTIEEKNRMIAEFMGYKIDIESINICELSESQIAFAFDYLMKPFQREKYMLGGNIFEIENVSELKYHASWDWLMPVVDKIESIHEESNGVKYFLYDIDITQHSCRIDSIGIHMGGFNSKIEATYAAVLAFIEWYNENK